MCGFCYGLAVLSPWRICVGDWENVSVVNTTNDTVISRLSITRDAGGQDPRDIAIVGDAILVHFHGPRLLLYGNGVTSHAKLVLCPPGLKSVSALSADGVSSFFVCDGSNNTVFVLDTTGKLCRKIKINTESRIRDCAIGDNKLWVACDNGDVVVMSSG